MKRFAIFLAVLPLAGCVSFGAKPPPSLLDLTAADQVKPGQEQDAASAGTITIHVPAVPQALATARVPVQATPTSIAYVKGAQWVEPPQRLFARLLSDTVAARTGRVVLGAAQSFGDPGARLSGELRAFGIDAASSSAIVTFDATLVRAEGGKVEKQRFEARVPVAVIDAASAGRALNQGANQVAAQVADWVGK
ncbi:ABC-type transport auxiliary lipoprotein family protein [uncultured Sphingomonas sp.]|uniref:ABC-type transport auxiliary lipoprotein family protein n=1 Tax=uncultured Sphingomonas sp. TaxID=158754 RepID=UPI002602C746|nr:ABC-type transport auxiliary lipoprotein family protein [uncultured Sphingomonas sp.]